MCEQKQAPNSAQHIQVKSEPSRHGGARKALPDEELTSNWTHLPHNFYPSHMDVIVGTGREAKNHRGNELFRDRLRHYIPRYSSADSKLEKTIIISEIVAKVQDQSPTGSGFVKRVQGTWYAVDDHQAREKVSQGLRNILADQYRSSAKSKKRKRGLVCAEMQKSIDEMMKAKRSFLSQRMEELATEMKKKGKDASEQDVEALFTQTNMAILAGLKSTEESDGKKAQPSDSQTIPFAAAATNTSPCTIPSDDEKLGDMNAKINPFNMKKYDDTW